MPAEKMLSGITLESEQVMTIAYGFCPFSAVYLRISGETSPSFRTAPRNRSLPSINLFLASSALIILIPPYSAYFRFNSLISALFRNKRLQTLSRKISREIHDGLIALALFVWNVFLAAVACNCSYLHVVTSL
jgi:hypothetical protein